MALVLAIWVSPRLRHTLLAIAMDETICLMLIGLYPVGMLYWIHRRRLRYGLADMALGFGGFGATLVPLSYLLEKSGFPLRNYPIIVLYVEVMVGVGFALALQRRGMLHEKFERIRLLVFMAHLIAPATIVPAVIMTGALFMPDNPFHNDWGSLLSWLALMLPPLAMFWFSAINEVRKSDTPADHG